MTTPLAPRDAAWADRIALIGYRGTGKTSVARELADQLGYSAVDADVELEAQAGRSISQIFAESGEDAFRLLEEQVLGRLLKQPWLVVATGGGAVTRAANRERLSSLPHVVWLRATAETIQQRLAGDETTASRRPQLTTTGGLSEIETLLAQREPWYQQCATLTIDTEDSSPQEIATQIATWVRQRRAPC